jgi:hypothetical protein
MPDARHVRNIQRDARVAVAIYSVPGPPGGNLGLQIRGAPVTQVGVYEYLPVPVVPAPEGTGLGGA